MPWKSSSSSVTERPKAMAKPKPGNKSIRGQISAPIPVADSSVGEFAEPKQLPIQAQDVNRNYLPNNTGEVTAPSRVASAAATQRVTISEASNHTNAPEGSKRLSKTQAKEPSARKKSPIRNALGRLFSRRKKTASQLTTASEPAQRSSAPPPQGKNENEDRQRGSGASRSASLPITEYDRALRSHSIGLDDVLAIQSARNSVNVDQIQAKKRNTGSPSPYPLGARYIGDGKLAGLCPRPASANDRDLHHSTIIADDPSEIGKAITIDGAGLKRRSRSMSAMSFFEANQEEHLRRSQEMKNLRESCFYGEDPLSPLSSEFPEDDALGTFNLDLPHPPRPAAPEPTTPEAFMFSNLISEEDAANRQQVEETTLNSRVNGIENRLHVLEDSVSLLRYKANPYANAGWKPSDDATGLGIQTSFSYPNTNTKNPHYSLSMGMAPTSTRPSTGHSDAVFTESSTSHSGGNYTTTQQPALSEAARPISEHTLRGQNIQSLLPQRYTSPLLEEQYTAILGLLETERSARIVLEAQVQQLTRQLHMLLGQHPRRGSEKAPPAAAPVSVFEYDADESESLGSRGSHARYNVWHPQQQQQQMPHHGYGLEDSGIDPGPSQHTMTGHEYDDNDTESTSQVYATPSEENHGAFGAVYANGEREEGGSSKPRAMSLSRMTMGPVPTAVM